MKKVVLSENIPQNPKSFINIFFALNYLEFEKIEVLRYSEKIIKNNEKEICMLLIFNQENKQNFHVKIFKMTTSEDDKLFYPKDLLRIENFDSMYAEIKKHVQVYSDFINITIEKGIVKILELKQKANSEFYDFIEDYNMVKSNIERNKVLTDMLNRYDELIDDFLIDDELFKEPKEKFDYINL